jgi:hypothetical protein
VPARKVATRRRARSSTATRGSSIVTRGRSSPSRTRRRRDVALGVLLHRKAAAEFHGAAGGSHSSRGGICY